MNSGSVAGAERAALAVLALQRVGLELGPRLDEEHHLRLAGPQDVTAAHGAPVLLGGVRLRVLDGHGRVLLADERGLLLRRGHDVTALDLIAQAIAETAAAFAGEVLRMTGFELCRV